MLERYQTVQDMLGYAEQFHQELSEYYRRRSQNTQDARLHMALEYLIHHEHNLLKALQRFQGDADSALLNGWLDHVPELDALPVLSEVTGAHDASDAEIDVINLALDVDEKLIQAYQALAREAGTPHVGELFEDLAAQLAAEQRQLQMASARLQDI